jgi:hypothetical protein
LKISLKASIMKTFNQLFILVGLMSFALILPASPNTGKSSASAQGKLTVSTVRVTEIKANQAKCSFTVQGSPVSEKGVCFSDGPSPTISSKKSMAPGNPTNSGTSIISGLKAGTTYYVRAYAKSGNEVFYGSESNFKTTVATDPPKNSQNTGKKVESKSETPKK